MDVKALKIAIKQMHGCDSKHLDYAWVTQAFRGRAVWDGRIEVFALKDHPTAKRCYAWSQREGNEMRTYAVLELPPVTSPESAVQAALFTGRKTKHRAN